MKILFLSHYFPPEVNAPATRTYEHCARWVKLGHQVTVVTCNPNHPHGKLYSGYQNGFWNEDTVSGIRVIRLWTFLSANKGFGLRTLNYIAFMLMSIVMCWRYGKQDIVISTSPHFFNGLAGYCVSRLKRMPWVLEIRDLWPESIVAVGALKEGFVTRMLYWLEGFCYRTCDLIVPVTESFRSYMIENGVPSEKIVVIKNGVDCNLFSGNIDEGESTVCDLFDRFGLQDKFIAAYVGTHGMAHHLETIVEAAVILKDRQDICFLLVGDGAERERLLEVVKQKKINNVVMAGQLGKHVMPALWNRVHVSLIVLRKSDTFKSVIPSKIFESLAMQKPIILGVEGESADLLKESASGVCIAPEDSTQLAAQVKLLADDGEYYCQLSRGGRQFVHQFYDRDELAKQYITKIEEFLSLGDAITTTQGGRRD